MTLTGPRLRELAIHQISRRMWSAEALIGVQTFTKWFWGEQLDVEARALEWAKRKERKGLHEVVQLLSERPPCLQAHRANYENRKRTA